MPTKSSARKPVASQTLTTPKLEPVKDRTQKTTVVPSAKPVIRKAAKAAITKSVAVVKPAEPAKLKKPKLVRDSFTMPKDEYVVIDALKLRAGKLGRPVKKSELLRAGIKALSAQSDIQFKAALSDVPTIKTGRPKDVK